MRRLRALVFYIAFFGVTALLGVAGLPLLLAPRRWVMRFGRFWARCVLAFLEPLPPGLPRREMMSELEARIEEATTALEREAMGQKGDKSRTMRYI